jgi:long-chain fatty acid transport protein
MKMMKNKSILIKFFITIISVCLLLHAQSILGTLYPTGIPVSPATGLSLGLGNSGTGLENNYLGMSKNPANLSIINEAIFSTTASINYLNLYDDGKSADNLTFTPRMLSFAFPLGGYGSLGISLDQRSLTSNKFDITLSNGGYRLGSIRKGGTTSWQIGYGISIKKYARIGLSYERLFFNDENVTLKMRPNVFSETNSISDSTTFRYSGNGIRGGIIVPLKDLYLGMSGEYVFINKSSLKRIVTGTTNDTLAQNKTRFDFKLPPSLNFGASYIFNPQWLVAADFGVTMWDRFYSDLPTVSKLDNAINFSAGTQFIPAPTLLSPKYYETIQYRVGFRYAQLPVKSSGEIAANIGFGLPLQLGSSIFDLNFEAGQRWDKRIKNYSERFFGIQLGINGGRKWYQPTDTNY